MTAELDDARGPVGRASGRRGGRPQADGLRLLPVLTKASDHPCFQCAKCCTYMAVEIDAPSTMKEYDHLVWYLYHEGVSVFVDWNGDWFLKFESRCRHLTPQGLCGIYERRPAICKDFDWRECENTIRDEPPDKWLFETAETFLAWLEERRPQAFRRYRDFLERKHGRRGDPELARLEPAPHGPEAGARTAR
jgi:Fe-S-cluster containining protein